MGTDKIRKYLIPNIPYLFILWAFLKLGTAYRLAAGNDFAHKLIGLGQTIGPAFADFAPGLVPLDWLVGIVGAVGFRLLIYFKSKNAKKFRRDAEYGSARWGTEKDIKPFVDPKFENNVILTGTEFLTMNTRPKIPANARNLNCCIIGSSGSGKTRFWLTPQLLQAHSSYVVVDPKGGVLGQVGAFLQKRGYKIKVFNSIDFSKSMHYNPLAYIRNEADILKFVDALISNTKGEGKEGDPFWTKSETLLYCALIAYIIFEGPAEDRNMNTLVDMISGMEVKEDDEDFMNAALAGPANKQGRIAADNIAGIESVYKGTYGASVVKLGKYAAASVGMTEKRLKADGKNYRKIYIHPSSSASYYPGASRMDIKLIFGDDGTIYGAQIIGEKGVDKRIDAIAQAMYAGFKADALGELELAYAPPFSSAKDPVNYAGFVASNVLTGKSTPVYAENIPDGAIVLDVREPSEVANGKIPNSINIPLGQLRGRLSEIDKSRLVMASCQVGLRGYLAERILKQNGFNAANLSGGYLTWKAVNSK